MKKPKFLAAALSVGYISSSAQAVQIQKHIMPLEDQ